MAEADEPVVLSDSEEKKVEMDAEEAEKIAALQKAQEPKEAEGPPANGPDVDARSVYVGNVDYSLTPEEVQAYFQSCGAIVRITIPCDKFSGKPKGFAYVEFADQDGVANAMLLNESVLKGRQIKVTPKRTNLPGFSRQVRDYLIYSFNSAAAVALVMDPDTAIEAALLYFPRIKQRPTLRSWAETEATPQSKRGPSPLCGPLSASPAHGHEGVGRIPPPQKKRYAARVALHRPP